MILNRTTLKMTVILKTAFIVFISLKRCPFQRLLLTLVYKFIWNFPHCKLLALWTWQNFPFYSPFSHSNGVEIRQRLKVTSYGKIDFINRILQWTFSDLQTGNILNYTAITDKWLSRWHDILAWISDTNVVIFKYVSIAT